MTLEGHDVFTIKSSNGSTCLWKIPNGLIISVRKSFETGVGAGGSEVHQSGKTVAIPKFSQYR